MARRLGLDAGSLIRRLTGPVPACVPMTELQQLIAVAQGVIAAEPVVVRALRARQRMRRRARTVLRSDAHLRDVQHAAVAGEKTKDISGISSDLVTADAQSTLTDPVIVMEPSSHVAWTAPAEPPACLPDTREITRGGHLKTAGGANFFVPHSIQCKFWEQSQGDPYLFAPPDLDPKVANPSGGAHHPPPPPPPPTSGNDAGAARVIRDMLVSLDFAYLLMSEPHTGEHPVSTYNLCSNLPQCKTATVIP